MTSPLAAASRAVRKGSDLFEQLSENPKVTLATEKFNTMKEHPQVAMMFQKREVFWTGLGVALLFHGAQFPNLFLCTQLIVGFCFDRVKVSVLAVYRDLTTAKEKMNADEGDESKAEADAKAEAKPSNKHAAKRESNAKVAVKPTAEQNEEDAASTKKLLKVLDTDKVSSVVFEVCVAAMACHMVMEGGLARAVIVAHALVTASKQKINQFLKFSGQEDMQVWIDLFVSFVLYAFFGGMALLMPSFAFAINLGVVGGQLVTEHGLRVAESMGKIPAGATADAFAASVKGVALVGGLTLFGSVWQFWALMADNGMAWYFTMLYLPAYTAENIVGLF